MPEALKNFGAEVTIAPVYKTEAELPAQINFDSIDLMTFTSSSTVKNFVAAYGIKKIPTAAIGSITAQTLKDFGMTPAVVAEEFTINGLVESIKNYYGK